MKRVTSLLAVPVLFVVFLMARPAAAQEADPAACDPADQAQISATLNTDGSEATFLVENAVPLCDPVAIGHAVYLKDADGLVFPQTLFASTTDTITEGTKTLTVQLPQQSTPPACFTQVDAFVGPVIQNLTDDNRYNDRLRAYVWGEVPTCAEVEAESTTTTSTTSSTTTSTSTTSTTSTSTTSTSTTTTTLAPPDTVLGNEVERPAPAPVEQGAVLARTGPHDDVPSLTAAAGFLLLIGGSLMAWSYRRTA